MFRLTFFILTLGHFSLLLERGVGNTDVIGCFLYMPGLGIEPTTFQLQTMLQMSHNSQAKTSLFTFLNLLI